jgi:predicted acetyltransferase
MGTPPRIEPLGRDSGEAVLDIDQWAFAFEDHPEPDPVLDELEWDRTFGAYLTDGDQAEALAGVYATFSLRLPVPGGSLPCAGLTWVGVHPQYRRRGVLSTMIDHHLAKARERGEPVSALHASEATIYGRFGYGVAGRHLTMTLPSGAALRDVPGSGAVRIRIERANVDSHADLVGDCYDAARRERPGMASRDSAGLRRGMFTDQPQRRGGAESLRIMVAEATDGGPARGYVLFSRRAHTTGTVPDGTVRVREFVARDPAATHALWSRLLSLDLMATVETDERPVDDPLLFLLQDQRSARPTVNDGIWVRIVDLPTALAGRAYQADVDAVLEVTDVRCPENAGRWRLTGGPEGAICVPATSEPDVVLDVRELSAAYLGSTSLTAMASAGLVRAFDAEILGHVANAFGWPVAASCGWGF